MATRYSVRHYHPNHPAIVEMANVCANEHDFDDSRRADANETELVAFALTAVALDAIRYSYPGIIYSQLAPLQPGLTPGTESYRWDELDVRGTAKLIENYADDLPDVGAFLKTNTGIIKTIGDSYQFTKQDMRRVTEARRLGRQAAVLDADKAVLAREMIERKKDQIAAYGDPLSGLPGILKNVNVSLLTGSTPASGSSKKWTGGNKVGAEVLADLRRLMSTVQTQSKGIHAVNTIVMPVEEQIALAYMPYTNGVMQTTVLAWFLESQRQMGKPVEIITWNRCATADVAGTGPRVLAYERGPDTVRLVETLDFEADPPQRVNFSFKIPCESRFGSIFWRRPLAGAYMDFV